MRTEKSEKYLKRLMAKTSPQEQAALTRSIERRHAEWAPRLKIKNTKPRPTISPDHEDSAVGNMLLMEALGTADRDFYNGLIKQLDNVALLRNGNGEARESKLNFDLAVVKSVKPRDHLEAMLATQMAAIHDATMTAARRLTHAEYLPQHDSYQRALNQLARTFAAQMQALKRYRTGGEQKVTVQHVSVSQGGQAIVGNVTQESASKKSAKASPAMLDAPTPAMPIVSERIRAPVPSRHRKKDGSPT
jgi:hypothetical protein